MGTKRLHGCEPHLLLAQGGGGKLREGGAPGGSQRGRFQDQRQAKIKAVWRPRRICLILSYLNGNELGKLFPSEVQLSKEGLTLLGGSNKFALNASYK